MKVYYSSASAGSGKTRALRKKAVRLTSECKNVLLVQPTTELIDRTAFDFRADSPQLHIEVMHQGTVKGSVIGGIMEYLNKPYLEPHALIITWSAFEQLSYFNRPKDWHFLGDEPPQADRFASISASVSHAILTEHLRTHPLGPVYSEVTVRNRGALRKVAENKTGETKLMGTCKDVARRMRSDKWLTFVEEQQYRKVIGRDGEQARILFGPQAVHR